MDERETVLNKIFHWQISNKKHISSFEELSFIYDQLGSEVRELWPKGWGVFLNDLAQYGLSNYVSISTTAPALTVSEPQILTSEVTQAETKVELSPSQQDIVLSEILTNAAEVPPNLTMANLENVDGNAAEKYTCDPLIASEEEIEDCLLSNIEQVGGTILVRELYTLVVGVEHGIELNRNVRSALNKRLYALIRNNEIELVENSNGESTLDDIVKKVA